MWVQSLGQEGPQRIAWQPTVSRVLAGMILWTEEPGGPQFTGSQSITTEVTQHAQGNVQGSDYL